MDRREQAIADSKMAGAPQHDELRRVQEVWDAQAQADPLWAVLSEPDRLGRRWDLDAFMATGLEHVSAALRRCEELGGTFPDRDLALDFGSGVGRLSQALGDHFDSVLGLDISPTMISVASRLNRHGSRVSFRLNESNRLEGVETDSVTLIFSHITLQHVPSDLAMSYLGEFLRVVKPGGIIIAQLPSHYSTSYLPADRDDLPVAIEDRSVSIAFPVHPGPLLAGQTLELEVDVTNASEETWTQSATHPLHLGNHWLDSERGTVAWDDSRARLPGRMHPREAVRITLSITAPVKPGTYFLSADIAQEGAFWFGDSASEPDEGALLELSVVVDPGIAVPQGDGDAAYFGSPETNFADLVSVEPLTPPLFEMNAVPRDEVEERIAEAGATLLGVDEWVNEWHSFTYYVQAGS
jgi:SAM-dependent methyltransferase